MTPNEYQAAALRTANHDTEAIIQRIRDGGEPLLRVLNGMLGLSGEGGEAADHVKKHIFQGHPLSPEYLSKELGDIAWYLAITADALQYPLEEIMQMNVDKLRARYPEGFSVQDSLNRKDQS